MSIIKIQRFKNRSTDGQKLAKITKEEEEEEENWTCTIHSLDVFTSLCKYIKSKVTGNSTLPLAMPHRIKDQKI